VFLKEGLGGKVFLKEGLGGKVFLKEGLRVKEESTIIYIRTCICETIGNHICNQGQSIDYGWFN